MASKKKQPAPQKAAAPAKAPHPQAKTPAKASMARPSSAAVPKRTAAVRPGAKTPAKPAPKPASAKVTKAVKPAAAPAKSTAKKTAAPVKAAAARKAPAKASPTKAAAKASAPVKPVAAKKTAASVQAGAKSAKQTKNAAAPAVAKKSAEKKTVANKTVPKKTEEKQPAKAARAPKPVATKKIAALPKPPTRKPAEQVPSASARLPQPKKKPVTLPPQTAEDMANRAIPLQSAAELEEDIQRDELEKTTKKGKTVALTSGMYAGIKVCEHPGPLPDHPPYSAKELEKMREILRQEREEALQSLRYLDNLAFSSTSVSGDRETPGYSTHPAEFASDYAAADTSLGLRNIAETRLAQVDEAMQRMEEGLYGVCVACGSKVGVERLKVKPFAVLCVPCRSNYEKLRSRGYSSGQDQ